MLISSNPLHCPVTLAAASLCSCVVVWAVIQFMQDKDALYHSRKIDSHKATLQNPKEKTIRWVKWRSDHTFLNQVPTSVSVNLRLWWLKIKCKLHSQWILLPADSFFKEEWSGKGLHDLERNLINVFQNFPIFLVPHAFLKFWPLTDNKFFLPCILFFISWSSQFVWKPIIELCHDQWKNMLCWISKVQYYVIFVTIIKWLSANQYSQ